MENQTTNNQQNLDQVKNIVLVHGAFADGSGWRGVYDILKGKGYNVSVVGNPNTGLADDVAATNRVLARQDGPAILVGHSYGGSIITEAGNHPNVAGLVYISAFVPDAGESVLNLFESAAAAPNPAVLPPENGFVWLDAEKFHDTFCADLPADLAAFMAASQLPLALEGFTDTIKQAAWRTKPTWYCVATEDQVIPPDAERAMAKRAGAKVTEVKGSHVIFISNPGIITGVIEEAAKSVLVNVEN